MSAKIIEINNVSVQYRDVKALNRISLDIEAGDYLGIVGPNGSGKTSLIKAILGLVKFSGTIRFQGKHLSEFTTANHIGYLPQKMAFLDQRFPATAREIVVSGVYCCKSFPKRLNCNDYKAAEEAMEILGITDLADRTIGRLSGGQQQRILLARALVHHPQLLILDEPTVALDPKSREIFYSTVKKLNKEKGMTILLVSHDVGLAGKYFSKLLYLDREVLFYGTFDAFCQSPEITDYWGKPATYREKAAL